MATTIDQYREAKSTFLKLRDQAKKDLLTRFNDLSEELLNIQRELREDFGHKIIIPTKPKKGRAKKAAPKPAATPSGTPKNAARVAQLQKSISLQRKKLDDTAKLGKPVKTIQDRIYELEDELRLAQEK